MSFMAFLSFIFVGNNNVYTNTRLQGYVGDGNCFAMGGICGHAGVFSQAQDIARFLQAMLRSIANPTNVSQPFFLNSTTIGLFTEISNETLSSRALGWDTNTDKVCFIIALLC